MTKTARGDVPMKQTDASKGLASILSKVYLPVGTATDHC